MAASDDEDDAQRRVVEHDKNLQLTLQVDENISFAVAQQQHGVVSNHDDASLAASTFTAFQEHNAYASNPYAARNQDQDDFEEVSSMSVARAPDGEEDGSLFLESYGGGFSDISSSIVIVSEEEKKSSSPLLVSQDSSSYDIVSSEYSSSYAARASQAMDEANVADGVGVVSSVSHLRESVTSSSTKPISESTESAPTRGARREYYYDILDPEHGDCIFQALFGEYGNVDPLLLDFRPPNGRAVNIAQFVSNPQALSLAARNASLLEPDDPKVLLEQYCERTFATGTVPEYTQINMTGTIRDRTFESVVQHPSIETVFVGKGKSKLESEVAAARAALASLLTDKDLAERAKMITISFRAAAAKLPFSVRFQLERSIHFDTKNTWLRLKRKPKENVVGHTDDLVFRARKLMIVYLQVVLPPLLGIEWSAECGARECITLAELFAEKIWDSLVEVKKAVERGAALNFFASAVQDAMTKARASLELTENVCDTTEAQLAQVHQGNYVETIRKRARWPVAMYSCKFDFNGALVPTELQLVYKAQSRRALREMGWPVRDRFLHMSKVKLDDQIVDSVQKATLCNRDYVYLFDKGSGKPTIWMYSPPTNGPFVGLSRDALLESIGGFDAVAATKLGDRIGLAFSETTPIDEIPLGNIVAEPELVGNGYRFSDGCGVMGEGIARKVQAVMNLPEAPGAIQIRIGGVKGMLSYKSGYPANKIGLRPSMVKFPSNHRMLEVKKVADTNRNPPLFSQLILVLHHQKILNRTLLELQAEACADMAMEFDRTAVIAEGESYDYVRTVVKHGRKQSGQAFSQSEFEALGSAMKEARDKVNLRCAVTMMFGVIDEHGTLDEGHVLVDNGTITGPVLISRSPCYMPGDIQKAHAVAMPSAFVETYSKLKSVIVFSSKGERPLADMLGGGDLDGDEFYIIHEKDLVEQMQSMEPHDYGSKEDSPSLVNIGINVQKSFSVPAAVAPDVSKQLKVLRELTALGDIVSLSSDAWIRVADVESPGSERAKRIADLCQRALDARKLALQIDKKQLALMKNVREKFEVPRWRGGGANCRFSNSILGILHKIWCDWMIDLEKAKDRRAREYSWIIVGPTDFGVDDQEEADEDTVAGTVASNVGGCIICWAQAVQPCDLCGPTVLLCSEECKRMHENEAGHTGGEREDSDAISTLSFEQESTDSFGLLLTSGIEALLNVVFGREIPTCSGARIDYRSLSESDLKILSNMVLVEFSHSLNESIKEDTMRSSGTPHEYDVFLMNNGELAVCRKDSSGALVWEDKDKSRTDIDETLYSRRVTSLSGSCRVLDSLMAKPAAGSLMEQAMRRDVISVVDTSDTVQLDSAFPKYLNESQQRVAEVALSMQSGILAVQGPPGTGKSATIVEIICRAGSGVLCCAPSNAAVANLARRVMAEGSFTIKEVVVWGENCDESVQYLNPVIRHKRWQSFWSSYQDTEEKTEKKQRLLDFAEWSHVEVKQERLLTAVTEHARLDSDDLSGKDAIASAKVLLCTLNTVGSPTLRNAAKFKFPTIILDEASQAPEAEFYILADFPGAKRIIVVGDPKQLSATVAHEGLKDAGYGESFLSHVLQYYPEKVHLLDVQYRMDPGILGFSNEAFYANRVSSDESVLGRTPHVATPFLVIDSSEVGRKLERPERSSWKNEYEVEVIKQVLFHDKDVCTVRSKVVGARTIVITPYRAQMRLLTRELKRVKSLRSSLDIATVDSFQGQEGDVVIVSTVRTESAGFVDSPNRLNVALTRSKRVLRVVGNMDFFSRIPGADSTLRKLAAFARQHGHYLEFSNKTTGFFEQNNCKTMKVAAAAWIAPGNWNICTWKPTLTSRFHECLKDWRRMEQNIAFNTVHAICCEQMGKLSQRPIESELPRWQTSSLRTYDQRLQIVWVAKELERVGASGAKAPYKGIVEVHFAGSRDECLQFKQKHFLVPRNACRVQRDMSGIFCSNDTAGAVHSTEIEVAWEIDDNIQDAIVEDSVQELPLGLFILDEHQEQIVLTRPPLLLESRSGMGKTEILFKHSLFNNPPSRVAPRTCFVTVSPNLCRVLQKRYEDVQSVEQVTLPRVSFFSFLGSRVHTASGTESVQSFVDLLLQQCCVTDMSVTSACSFLQYVHSRASHEELEVDPSLVESEVGGVILGSLAAAKKKGPLSRHEYMAEIRSNVLKDSKEGLATRKSVYDEYAKYQSWKLANKLYDTNDIVLRLIQEIDAQKTRELFHSAYLDEVQDFSYAALLLICSIAGKTEARWTAAGDTAQLISPGCSFTFSGMKETLLTIRGDIKLRKVVRLKRNYRMNRGTLDMANAILKVIKHNFPKAIDSFQEEEAMKDLGLKVVLLDWDEALKYSKTPTFGPQQACVYASDSNLDAVRTSMNEWLKNHPFVLSSLDSKGLEFDDVVVAFNFDRKVWNIDARRNSSLKMCRELYVAVTRAKRRAVVLVKRGKDTAMVQFFQDLECELEVLEPEVIMQEFQKETSLGEWLEQGKRMFEDRQFKLAASCFNAAEEYGQASYAEGLHFLSVGKNGEAKDIFRTAAKIFFEASDFGKCLDAFKELANLCLKDLKEHGYASTERSWNEADNDYLDAALKKLPGRLDRKETVNFALLRSSWKRITAEDLAEYSDLFHAYRGDMNLKEKISAFSENERIQVERVLPLVVGDYYLDIERFSHATELFLRGRDQQAAIKATEAAIRSVPLHEDLSRVANCWRRDDEARQGIPPEKLAISLLVSIFESPKEASRIHAESCMKELGRSIVKLAVDNAVDADVEELYSFSRTAFQTEVLAGLENRYSNIPIEVVRWYQSRNEKEQARNYATQKLSSWSNDDLLGVIVPDKDVRPSDLLSELSKPTRKGLVDAVKVCLSTEAFDLDFAKRASDKALSSDATENADRLMEENADHLMEKNADRLMELWHSRRNDPRVKQFLSREVDSSSMALLWHLFSDPETAGRQYGKKCINEFGTDIVRKAVLKKKGSDKSGTYALLCLFDKKKFESDKPPPEPKPSPRKQAAKRDDATDAGKRTTANLDKLQVGERIVVTGLRDENNLYLNGKCGKVVKVLKKDSYLTVLDSDKPNKDGSVQKRKLKREKLKREESTSSDSSDDSEPPALFNRGRSGHGNDDESSSSSDSDPLPQKKPSHVAAKKAPSAAPKASTKPSSSVNIDASLIPSLFQEGNNSSIDDVDDDELEDMPGLESKASSEDSTDSEGAFPKDKGSTRKKKAEPIPSHVDTEKQEEVSSDDDSSVSPLGNRASPPVQDDNSESTISDMPVLLSGENSSDESSAPELKQPRMSRNASTDDSSDEDVPEMSNRSRFQQKNKSDKDSSDYDTIPIPGLEFAHGNQSNTDDSSDNSSNQPPDLMARPVEQDSSDSSAPPLTGDSSDDEMPDLIDRDGRNPNPPSPGFGQRQQPQQSSAPNRRKPKGKSKKRRGRGGRGRK